MIGRKLYLFSVGTAILFALGAFTGVAKASCSNPVTGTVTCTGGTGAHVVDTNNTATFPPPTVAAQTGYGTTIDVTGGGAAVKTVSITLHGYTSVENQSTGSYSASYEMGLMLVSPSGHNMEILRCPGFSGDAQTNMTVTLQDGGTTIPNCSGTNSTSDWTTSGTYAPASYPATENEPTYPSPAPALAHSAATNGSATLNSVGGVFTGDTINGNWSLYLVSDAYFETDVQFSSWDITITYTAATTPTATTLSPSPSTAFTSSPGNSVTLTATVTGSGATGTVLFQNGSSTIAGCGAVALSSGQAQCTTTFSTEGLQSLSATYSGDGTFVGSSGTANVFTYNHATNPTGTTYCNAGTISSPGSADVLPYPSVIFVGDGTANSPSISGNSVDTVSVTLKSFSSNDTNGLHMLLVAPDGTHTLEFWGDAGAGADSSGNYTIQDGSPAIPNSALTPGTYSPTANFNYLVFTLATPIPAPAPQPPSGTSYSMAEPAGSATFESSFVGATANGKWLLFVDSEGSPPSVTTTTASIGGWCIDISPATGTGTTTGLTSSPPEFATKGSPVQFTATVSSSPTVNKGTVTFTENGSPLVGAPNSGVANVSSGVATISTSSLPEGDHTISATYHDSSATYNDSVGTETMRVDAATPTPTLAGSTWTYCNTSGITIPAGSVFTNDTGPAAPNPSNIFVTNLPGTIDSVSLTINSFSVEFPGELESLLVGPAGPSVPVGTPVPGQAQTLDFFSPNAGVSLSPISRTTTFADIYSPVPTSGLVPAQVAATSRGATLYTASAFYNLPGTFNYAPTQGSSDFNDLTHGVYTDANPNGTWSLYFDQTEHHTGDSAGSWCMDFTENPVTVTATKGHTGSAPSNDFVQGEQNAQFTVAIKNNGPGPTGDPDGNHPLTVTDALNSAFTFATYSGTDWSCTGTTTVTCVNHDAVAQGSSYPTLTLFVNVSNTAASSIANTANVSGGGVTATLGSDTVTIDPAPVLSVTKNHPGTFKQGQTAEWDITVNNIASGSTTGGTTTVSDSLPSGYTISTITASGWSCGSSVGTSTLGCTSTQVVAGGSSFSIIEMFVNVPANSPTSVSNTALAWGGGDLAHTGSGNAASGTDNSVPVTQVPASISASGGGGQSTNVSTAFAAALQATVLDGGSNPIQNVTVTFTAPSTGQSGTFPGGFLTATASTNSSGVATSPTFTANATSGGYNVVASVSGLTPTASFGLTNNAVYTNVSNSVSVTSTGLSYNKIKAQGTETVTIKNTSATTISGPVEIVLTLSAGVTAVNNTGTFGGNPYWKVTAGSIAPGTSAQVTVTLGYASSTTVTTTSSVYSGSIP
jgi:large repetitive protein